jgi:hypothetical protein
MILKTNFISSITISCLLALFVSSCSSCVQKPDDAFDLLKKERMLSNDSNFVSEEIIMESMKTEPVKKKIESPDEWTRYKNELEMKIRQNENKINELKRLSEKNSTLLKKVKYIERDNANLLIEMDKYNEEVKLKWEMFKTSMNHKVNTIDIELDEIKALSLQD